MICLKDCLKNSKIKADSKVLVTGFGVGLSWAGTVLRF